MKLLYPQADFACYNYETGQSARLEILKLKAGEVIDRTMVDTEIVFQIEGRYHLSYNELLNADIPAGKIMLYPPGGHVVAEVLEDAHLIICRVHDVIQLCECMTLERLYSESGIISAGFHMLDINPRINKFVELLVECVDDGLRCTYFFETKMRELFFLLRAYYSKEELAGFFSPLLGRDAQFMNLMYRNYLQANSVRELAELSNYSLSGFKKQFRRVFGSSPSRWMEQQKARRVFLDLNHSQSSIKELAEQHGFSSVAAFSTFCHRQFGMPPGKIRLNIEQIDPEKLKVAVR